jgi:F0F1-type ATP synthase assembly protein I
LGIYFAIAQVGLEMAVPVGVGLFLDNSLDWRPWGVIVGAVLGLAIGLTHLAVLSQRSDKTDEP